MRGLLPIRLALIAAAVVPVSAAEPQNGWDWMLRLQEEKDAPLVEYCGEQIPNMKGALDALHLRYLTHIREVYGSLRERALARPELARLPDPKLVASLQELPQLRLGIAKMQEAAKVCSELEATLLRVTAASVRAELEEVLAKPPPTALGNGESPQ